MRARTKLDYEEPGTDHSSESGAAVDNCSEAEEEEDHDKGPVTRSKRRRITATTATEPSQSSSTATGHVCDKVRLPLLLCLSHVHN